MSDEYAPMGGDGATADDEPSVSDERTVPSSDLDALFEVLASGVRRQVLAYLHDAEADVVSFSDLVEHVTEVSAGRSPDDRDSVAVNLHHNHLPKLCDAGVVEYDRRSETIRYRGDPDLSDWMGLVQSNEPHKYRG